VKAPSWRRYVRFWRADPRADADEELRFHIESRVDEYVAAGMTPEQARVETMRRFGDVERVRRSTAAIDAEYAHEQRRAARWEALSQDLRYAARTLRRNPAFTAIAVLTLALGIGANTAIFSVVNGVLLRPLPYAEPDRLVRLFTAFRGSGQERYAMSQPEFMDYKGLTRVFSNAAAFAGSALTLTGTGDPERVRGLTATRDLLPVLGVVPLRGRNFQGDEGRAGLEPVVLVSHEFWQNRFGGDPALLDRVITLNGIGRRVIGILPPGVAISDAEAIIPLFINPDSLAGRGNNYLRGVARLRPGVTVEQAQRELNALTRRLAAQYPNAYPVSMGYGATVVSMRDVIVGDVRPALLILLGAVGLVLLIACANVANLLLARGEARQREIAVRIALGAGRGRIVRQLLTESTLLAVVGGALGVVLAWWGMKALLSVNPDAIPRMELVRIDLRVGLATMGLCLLTGVLFGLAPAMQLVRTQVQSSLKEATRGGTVGRSQQRLGRGLVIAEVALAVVIVIGAALLMRSFWLLRSADPGFESDRVLAVDLGIPASRYTPDATVTFYTELVQHMRGLPGVQVAGAISELPPVAGGYNWDIAIDGRPLPPGQAAPSPNVRAVVGDYFRALSIPLVRGRLFGASDVRGAPPVVVINETAARTIWPNVDPIGQRIRFGRELPWITVIGVARDVRSVGLADAVPPEVYLVHEQMPAAAGGAERAMYVVLKTAGNPLSLANQARSVVRQQDPLVAITGIRTLDDIVNASIARPRFTMLLLGVFGGVALALATVGIYGIMSYAVKRRTREIGIRMAMGARPTDVLHLVVRQGMTLAMAGLFVGVIGAVLATRLMGSLLYGVSATDPLTFVAIIALLTGIAFFASWIPARRAVLTDPSTALRND